MQFNDVELFVECLLIAAFIAFFLAVSAMVAAFIYLFRCKTKYDELIKRLSVARDNDGRPYRERL
jgi:hypothetical protein